MLTDQQEVREDEYLDPDTYDKVPFRSLGDNNNDDDNDDQETTPVTDCIEFRVPIERSRNSDSNKANWNTTWQLPAMACPPVWWIVVDGTVGVGNNNGLGASRNYWSTVGSTLMRAIEDIPPHVHVGLITCTGSRLANWDLTSAVPHVKQYPYSYDPATALAKMGYGDYNDDDDDDEYSESLGEAWDLCLVPANGEYKANLLAAIRAMVDGAGLGIFVDQFDDTNTDTSTRNEEKKSEDDDESPVSSNMPLAMTLEIILEFMEQARHPGDADDDSDDDDDDDGDSGDDDDNDDNGLTRLRYAGGKILCVLGNPPSETANPPSDDSMSYVGQSKYGLGGVAGACRAEDEEEYETTTATTTRGGGGHKSPSSRKPWFGANNKNEEDKKEEETDLTDMTPSNLAGYVSPLDSDDLFFKIGGRCGQAALGVDLVVLVPEEDDIIATTSTTTNGSNNNRTDRFYKYSNEGIRKHIPWYGLPLLRPLSDCSGAPGPLMFGTANSDIDKGGEGETEAFERLHENILVRTPWQNGMVFGVQMCLRVSPGFRLEATPIEREKNLNLQLSPFLNSGGLAGPAVCLANDDDDDDDGNTNTWVMGTCDPHTSFVVDMETVGTDELPSACEMEGFGEVELKPVLQTSIFYTCIETDDADNYFTVCKMKVSSVSLEYADNPESIYDGLDTEALSVILYHKIALDAYTSGFIEAQKTAEMWFQATMQYLYASAKVEHAAVLEKEELKKERKQEENLRKLEELKQTVFHKKPRSRRRSEPMEESDDEDDANKNFLACERLLDVKGGELEESDVVLGQGHFKMNALPLVVYAIMQCDALRPSGGNFQPSMDARLCALAQMASMTPTTLAKVLAPSISLWSLMENRLLLESLPLSREGILCAIEDLGENSEKDTVLFLDSPQRVVLFDIDELLNDEDGESPSAGTSTTVSASKPIELGLELQSSIRSALVGSRTAPSGSNALQIFLKNYYGGNLGDIRVPPSVLDSLLVEDTATKSGDRDFIEWKVRMAEAIIEEVDYEEDGYDDKKPSTARRLVGSLLPFWKK